jgi:outer membrane protein with beta-barrel domain
MRKAMWLLALVPLFTLPASAQELPQVEVFGGPSYQLVDVGGTNFHLTGWNGEISQNLNSWFGGTLSATGYYGRPSNLNVNVHSFMYGPLFTYRKSEKFTPFAHVMLGVVRASRGYLGISKTDTDFGATAGVGLDVKAGQHLAVRVFQVDYLVTPYINLRQDNVKFSAGIVLRFGTKH